MRRGGGVDLRPTTTPPSRPHTTATPTTTTSGREIGSQQQWDPHQPLLSNTRPLHHRNSVGTCCGQRVAQ